MLTVITPPATEPITLNEMKLHSRIDGSDDDTLIEGLITAARMQLEQMASHRLKTELTHINDSAKISSTLSYPFASAN